MLGWQILTTVAFQPHGARTCRQRHSRSSDLGRQSTGILVTALCMILVCSGCTSLHQWAHNRFKVGPNYCKPQAPVASEWIDYQDPQVITDQSDLAEWWHVFNDPNLDALIETAYRQNISLRVAGTRILAARAERGIAAGQLFPQSQNAVGAYAHAQVPGNILPLPSTFSFWTTGLAAGWELDFWGASAGRSRRLMPSWMPRSRTMTT